MKLSSAFACAALAVIALPLACFQAHRTVSERENRSLAARPYLCPDGRLNGSLFSEYDAYIADHIGLRMPLIRLSHQLEPYFQTVSGEPSTAIAGKDGWYFYVRPSDGNNLADFYKRNLLDERGRAAFRRNVEAAASWCAGQGIPALFVICPNKHSVYPEFYPYGPRPDGPTRADQLAEELAAAGAAYVFPRDELLARKEGCGVPLYYETDTHWNPLGAYIAFGLIRRELGRLLPGSVFPDVEYEMEVGSSDTEGDILPMLGVERAHSTRPVLTPKGGTAADYYTYLQNGGRDGVHTLGKDASLPRALVFRDSFCTALEPYLSPLFGEALYVWKQFRGEDKAYIEEYRPDIIIFESVERYAPTICGGR